MSQRTKNRYNGKDFWGPPSWTTIHILATSLHPSNAEKFKEFLWLLTKLLPCDYCKKNLKKKLEDHPPDEYLHSQEQAFMYSYIIHDLANQHITKFHPQKPKISPPFDDVQNIYFKGVSRGSKFWGPPIWTFIHVLAVTLRADNGEDFKRLLEIITDLLPDEKSRGTAKWILEQYPPDPYIRNNHDAFFYTFMIHDAVNKLLRKSRSPSYDSVKSFYFSALGEECNDCKI